MMSLVTLSLSCSLFVLVGNWSLVGPLTLEQADAEPEYAPPYFLYLIMGRGARPAYLDEVLHTNRSRLVMLSWQHNTSTTDVFMPQSTITTGRIRLGEYAYDLERHLGHKFLYWIWMDEDARFGPEPVHESVHKWEEFLLDWQPAVGVAEYYPRHRAVLDALQAKPDDIWSVFSFDGIFNAQHHETLRHMTPLNATYDHVSWHMSALINLYRAGSYVDHVLEYRGLKVSNPEHKSPVNYEVGNNFMRRIEPHLPGEHMPAPIAECIRASGRHHYDVSLMMWGTPRKKYWSYENPTTAASLAKRQRSWAVHNLTACVRSTRGLDDTTPLYVHRDPV